MTTPTTCTTCGGPGLWVLADGSTACNDHQATVAQSTRAAIMERAMKARSDAEAVLRPPDTSTAWAVVAALYAQALEDIAALVDRR